MLSFAILVAAVAGCKSKSVSRVYPTDMDATWAAVLKVVEKAGTQKPMAVDRESGKIITGLVYGDVGQQISSDTPTMQSTMDVWRGIITCKPEGAGTKVTVRLQMVSIEADDDPSIVGTKRADVGIVFWTSKTDWQKKLLDDVGTELTARQAVPGA